MPTRSAGANGAIDAAAVKTEPNGPSSPTAAAAGGQTPGSGRVVTTDASTQQQLAPAPPQLLSPAAAASTATPSASAVSSPSSRSQGGTASKQKGRSGPKSKCSPFIGVSQYKRTKRWEAHIWDSSSSTKGTPVSGSRGGKGKQLHLGSFPTSVHAARAYDRAALLLRGPDAQLNFPAEEYDQDALMQELRKLPRPQMILALRKSADMEAEEAALDAFSAKVPHLLASMAAPTRNTAAAAAVTLSSDGTHPSGSLTHTLPSPAMAPDLSGTAAAAAAAAAGGYVGDFDWLQAYEQQIMQQQQQQQQGEAQFWIGQELGGEDRAPVLAGSHHQQQQQFGQGGYAGLTSANHPPHAGFTEPWRPGVYTQHTEPWATQQPAAGSGGYPWTSQHYQQQQQQHPQGLSQYLSLPTSQAAGHPYSYPHSSSFGYQLPHQRQQQQGLSSNSRLPVSQPSASPNSSHTQQLLLQGFQFPGSAAAAAAGGGVQRFEHHTRPQTAAAVGLAQHGTAQQSSWHQQQVWQQQQQWALQGSTAADMCGNTLGRGTELQHLLPRASVGDSAAAHAAAAAGAAAAAYQHSCDAAAAATALHTGHSRLPPPSTAAAATAAGLHGAAADNTSSFAHTGHRVPTRSSSSIAQWLNPQQQQHAGGLWPPQTSCPYQPAAAPHLGHDSGAFRSSALGVEQQQQQPQQHGSYRTQLPTAHLQASQMGVQTPPSAAAAVLTPGGSAAAFQHTQHTQPPWQTAAAASVAGGQGAAAPRDTIGSAAGVVAPVCTTGAPALVGESPLSARMLAAGGMQQLQGQTHHHQQQQEQQYGAPAPHLIAPLRRQHTPAQAAVLNAAAAAAAGETEPQPGSYAATHHWQRTQPAPPLMSAAAAPAAGGSNAAVTAGVGGSAAGLPAPPVRQLSMGAQATLLAAWHADYEARTAAAAAAAGGAAPAGVSLAAPAALPAPTLTAAAAGAACGVVRRNSSGVTAADLAREPSGTRPGAVAAVQRRNSSMSAELLCDLLMGCEQSGLHSQHSLPGLDILDALLAGSNGSPTMSGSGFGLSSEGLPVASEVPADAAAATAFVPAGHTSAAAAIAAGAAALASAPATAPAAAVGLAQHAVQGSSSALKRPLEGAVAAGADGMQVPAKRARSGVADAALNSAAAGAAAAGDTAGLPGTTAAAAAGVQGAGAAAVGGTAEGLAWLQLMKE